MPSTVTTGTGKGSEGRKRLKVMVEGKHGEEIRSRPSGEFKGCGAQNFGVCVYTRESREETPSQLSVCIFLMKVYLNVLLCVCVQPNKDCGDFRRTRASWDTRGALLLLSQWKVSVSLSLFFLCFYSLHLFYFFTSNCNCLSSAYELHDGGERPQTPPCSFSVSERAMRQSVRSEVYS